MIKLGNKEFPPKDLLKVTIGSSLVWEKSSGNTVSFNSVSDLSPFSRQINFPKNIYSTLKGKKITEITIDGVGSFADKEALISDKWIYLSKSLDEFLGVTDFIRKGTKITITYK